MSLFEPNEDFAEFVDGLELVTLRRRESTEALQIKSAYRLSAEVQEAEPSGGTAQQVDAVWHLQLPGEATAPQLGDIVVDQAANQWTILETQQLTLLDRWKCVTRELRIANGCNTRVDVERAIWEDNGSGLEIVEWKYVCTALPVRIQPDEQKITDASATPPVQQAIYQVMLSESIAIEPDDRLVAGDSVRYRVQSVHQAERIDVLPMVKALREET